MLFRCWQHPRSYRRSPYRRCHLGRRAGCPREGASSAGGRMRPQAVPARQAAGCPRRRRQLGRGRIPPLAARSAAAGSCWAAAGGSAGRGSDGRVGIRRPRALWYFYSEQLKSVALGQIPSARPPKPTHPQEQPRNVVLGEIPLKSEIRAIWIRSNREAELQRLQRRP